MKHPDHIGQTLDGKYRIERELGRGGMGTVYLATHLGTERPVAVKIIAPQYMQRSEFVERFRREARAAGRLRHPNVVDVTDFGFAETSSGQVAYLVMEYLDGCTLGEILDEERNLPVQWTLDILEQVCSAVQEAHEQGIIHRDLKPDNIWLEPNQRGGYTVKVLDFGIAKLEHQDVAGSANGVSSHAPLPTITGTARETLSGARGDGTVVGDHSPTFVSEAETIVQTADHGTLAGDGATVQAESIGNENKTAIFIDSDKENIDQDTIGTRIGTVHKNDADLERPVTAGKSLLDTPSNAGLTRVGAVLGTPLYMSPEQCRGEHLDTRSDIYSLGVIAYQMLSGSTPFVGDYKDVMESHMSMSPRPLKAKGVRRKMRHAVHQALEKNPDDRPQTAEGFASVMRSRSEGIFGLLRRALVIYSEHLPKFVLLTAFFEIPVIVLTVLQVTFSFLRVSGMVTEWVGTLASGAVMLLVTLASAFCATLIVGTIVWIVTQYLAVPLRPVRLRPALFEVRKKWKKLAGSGVFVAIGPFVTAFLGSIAGLIVLGVVGLVISPFTGLGETTIIISGVGATLGALYGFFWGYVNLMLVSPVVMMESVSISRSLLRSRQLVKRSFMTSIGAGFIMFLIPMLLAASVSLLVNVTSKAIDSTKKEPVIVSPERSGAQPPVHAPETAENPIPEKSQGLKINVGPGDSISVSGGEQDMQSRVKHSILESLVQLIWLPLQIFILSFSAIIVALLYLKTRLAGGESMNELIERFEDEEGPRKKWQERVRQRLIQSGRIPSKS